MTCVSYTFDDGRANHVSLGSRVLDEFGFSGTFYVCPGLVEDERYERKLPKNNSMIMASWGEIEDAAKRGHEIGNHSWSHTLFDDACRGKTDEEVESLAVFEIHDAAYWIYREFSQKENSWAWPCHRIEPRVLPMIEEYHVGVRPKGPRGCYNAILSKRAYVRQLNEFVDMLEETGLWGVPIIHNMGDDRGMLSEDVFRSHLEYVSSKDGIEVKTVAEVLLENRPEMD